MMDLHDSEAEKYIIVINICEFIIGFIGNLTASIVILCSRSMNTLADFYLLSLSLSDLMILITGVLNHIHRHVHSQSYRYLFSGVGSYIRMWIFDTSVYVSIFTVTTFTVERYLAICRPFSVQSMAKASRAKKIIIIIWMVAAVLAVLTVFRSYALLHYTSRSVLAKIMPASLPAYTTPIYAFVFFVLPMLLITTLYVMITIKLMKISNERQSIASQADPASKKTLMMFAVIILVFLISWLPYYSADVFRYHTDTQTYKLVLILYETTYSLSSVLNPIIYVIMSKKFRGAFKDFFSNSQKELSNSNTRNSEGSLEMSN